MEILLDTIKIQLDIKQFYWVLCTVDTVRCCTHVVIGSFNDSHKCHVYANIYFYLQKMRFYTK